LPKEVLEKATKVMIEYYGADIDSILNSQELTNEEKLKLLKGLAEITKIGWEKEENPEEYRKKALFEASMIADIKKNSGEEKASPWAGPIILGAGIREWAKGNYFGAVNELTGDFIFDAFVEDSGKHLKEFPKEATIKITEKNLKLIERIRKGEQLNPQFPLKEEESMN
jgi:hypothetical protein